MSPREYLMEPAKGLPLRSIPELFGWLPIALAALRLAEWSRETEERYNLAQSRVPEGSKVTCGS
jgi:hypothetical protein